MISYKDKAFCSSDCTNSVCPRNYSDEEHIRNMSTVRLPVSMADFSPDCPDYISGKGNDVLDDDVKSELGVVVE